MSFKKVKTVYIFDKPKCIYMKPKGTREYVKSKGEMVLLSVYMKKAEKVAAKKALASKMAKKSKALRNPMRQINLRRRSSLYGGFFNEDNDENEYNNENEYEDEKELMSGGKGFEELVSQKNINELMSFLKTTGGKKMKRVSKPKKLKHVSSVALMKRRGIIKRRGGEGLNMDEQEFYD